MTAARSSFRRRASLPDPVPDPPASPGGAVAWDKNAPKILPQLAVAKEHYNRLVRMIQQGEKPRCCSRPLGSAPRRRPDTYNTVAEIPGTDLKEQALSAGAAHGFVASGEGATDNAAGVSVGDGGPCASSALLDLPR
ncbi:MAG: hypothetical protein U0835_15855 [Isosphaeraceae bacterium]